MEHFPVLLEEAAKALVKDKNGHYLDCTFGRGGHSREILRRLGEEGFLLALDRDLDAICSESADELKLDRRFELKHMCFSELEQAVKDKGWKQGMDGVLMDLGVSSPQLDDSERGFSFLKDGPLDMRMNRGIGETAAEWLNQVEEKELVRVLFRYGEERFARRIASAVIDQRGKQAITTTLQFAALIEEAVPVREKFKHPATRSFQAIRIEINSELKQLEQALDQSVRVLRPGGRLVVISFHSLEDRIVKRFIRDHSRGKYTPDKLPVQNITQESRVLKKIGRAQRAGKEEVAVNSRARSAIMRIAERL